MDAPATLGALVRDELDSVVDELMERQWYEVPEFWVTDDRAFHDAVLRSTRENVALLLDLVEHPAAPPRVLCPGGRLEADVTARYGASTEALVRTYHLCEHTMAERFLEIASARTLDDPAGALREIGRAMRAVHAYLGAVVPLAVREHAAELERVRAHPDLRRLRDVEAALAGDHVAALDYPLDDVHVAVVTGAEGAERALAELAGELETSLLSVRATDGRCWAWLASADANGVAERLRRSGLSACVGIGAGSFRTAHEHATLAEAIARDRGSVAVVDLRGVALEALALGDRRTAYAVARAELGPLASEHPTLRSPLEAWFASRETLAGAAATLGVAPRTVSYRLRRAETLLGHPIAARRAELEAALRVERLLAARS